MFQAFKDTLVSAPLVSSNAYVRFPVDDEKKENQAGGILLGGFLETWNLITIW